MIRRVSPPFLGNPIGAPGPFKAILAQAVPKYPFFPCHPMRQSILRSCGTHVFSLFPLPNEGSWASPVVRKSQLQCKRPSPPHRLFFSKFACRSFLQRTSFALSVASENRSHAEKHPVAPFPNFFLHGPLFPSANGTFF